MKAPLSYAWRERPLSDGLMPALESALSAAPKTVRNGAYRYHHALVAPTPTLVHEVHVLHDAEAKRSLVSWTGRGVRANTVIMVEGAGLEAVRRRIESGAISSVPRALPSPPRAKVRKPRPTPRIACLPASPSRKSLPPP